MNQEIISVHLGQAGLQMGHAFWELACAEHCIDPNGDFNDQLMDDPPRPDTFFHETPAGQHVPRAFLVDLEPTVLDEIRIGKYHRLFHPELMMNGKEDTGNNYARGFYTLGRPFIAEMIERTRIIAEGCENCQGFFLYNSFGGGTGSGLTSLYMDRLRIEFGKKPFVDLAIYTGNRLVSSTVEPYNSIFAADRTLDVTDMTIPFDNESFYDISKYGIDHENPTFSDINRLIAPMVSNLTGSIRFGGSINCSINEIRTNIIPYPRIHFPFISYAPMLSGCKVIYDRKSATELTLELFYDHCRSVNCNIQMGKFMCACLIYRGNNNAGAEIHKALHIIKNQRAYPWVDWCPTGYKVGHAHLPPVLISKMVSSQLVDNAVIMLGNHTAISQTFANVGHKFDVLFKKRAFVHWFVGEGMEEDEFSEARCTIAALERDYFEISECSSDEVPEPTVHSIEEYKKLHEPPEIQYIDSPTVIEPFNISQKM